MLCRFCLCGEGEMLAINGKDPSRLTNSIREKIFFTTSIKIPAEEETAVICINCDILLNGYYIFKKRSWANNVKAQELVQQQSTGENKTGSPRAPSLPDVTTVMETTTRPSKRLLPDTPPVPDPENDLLDELEQDWSDQDDILKYLRLKEAPNNYLERKQCASPNGWGVMLIRRCNECGAKFTALSELRRHKSEMGHKDPRCEVCQRTFYSPAARDSHVRKKHRVKEEKPVDVATPGYRRLPQRRCTECGECFTSLPDLRIHKKMLGHSDPTCSICQRKFVSKDACDRHLRKKHKVNHPSSVQKCSICGLNFAKKKDLLAHISVHITGNERNTELKSLNTPIGARNKKFAKYLCSQCGKGFPTMKSIQQHKDTVHTVPRSGGDFTCPICSKVFHYKKRLEDHVRLHIGFTPVQPVAIAEPLEEGEIRLANPTSAAKKSPRIKKSWNRYDADADFVISSNSSSEKD